MEKNIKDKKYTMEEAVAYYILGYKMYEKYNKKNGLVDILKNIVEVAKQHLESTEITGVNIKLLKRINFNWELSGNDFIAYAICIFYVLINREKNITAEKIVTEFLREVHSHHPRKTIKEATIIAETIFPELSKNKLGLNNKNYS